MVQFDGRLYEWVAFISLLVSSGSGMASKGNKYALGYHAKPGFRLDRPLNSAEQCSTVLQDLLETPPDEFQGKDIAVLNLICAPAILGSETLDIPGCIGRLDRLAAQVKGSIDRNIYKQPNDPDYGHCEPMWRMSMLVTVIKRTYGVAYDPEVIAEGKNTMMDNSRRVFLNGVLDKNRHRRHGTCASIPVLVAAVAHAPWISRWTGSGWKTHICPMGW